MTKYRDISTSVAFLRAPTEITEKWIGEKWTTEEIKLRDASARPRFIRTCVSPTSQTYLGNRGGKDDRSGVGGGKRRGWLEAVTDTAGGVVGREKRRKRGLARVGLRGWG